MKGNPENPKLGSKVNHGLYFIFLLFILAVLGLCGCKWAFSSWSEHRLFFIAVRGLSHCGGFSCCRAWALWHTGFSSCSTQAQQLWRTDLVALRHVGSSQTRDRTRVPCIGRQILNHCITREVPELWLLHTDGDYRFRALCVCVCVCVCVHSGAEAVSEIGRAHV